jgi:tRNA pseudouridine38-40 synthase
LQHVCLKLTIEYDGSKYSGWAEQQNARSVMGVLREALSYSLRGELELMGAGRTDAGVHARGQVAHVKFRAKVVPPLERMLREWNQKLPADVVVLSVERAAAQFHARHDAVARRYVYQISRRKTAFDKKYVWWIKEPLDVAAMREAAALIVGRHDFRCFQAVEAGRKKEGSVVVVERAEVREEGDRVLFEIEASHFVWRMVRRLTGALVKVGLGELALGEFAGLLEGKEAEGFDVAANTAPAAGLFLAGVRYR